jgi:hypothetical protein
MVRPARGNLLWALRAFLRPEKKKKERKRATIVVAECVRTDINGGGGERKVHMYATTVQTPEADLRHLSLRVADMEAFDNYNDSGSQYGPLDDTASMFSGYTSKNGDDTLNLESLSIADNTPVSLPAAKTDEDFDGVLDDLKEDGAVALPPHACRSVQSQSHDPFLFIPQLLRNPLSSLGGKVSRLLQVVLQLARKQLWLSHRQPPRARET